MVYRAGIVFLFLFLQAAHAQKFKCINTFTGHPGKIEIVHYSPDNKYFLTSDSRGYIFFWTLPEGKVAFRMKAHTGKISGISFSHRGDKMITTTYDGELKVWNWQTQKELYRTNFKFRGRVTFALYDPTDSWIYFDYDTEVYRIKADLGEDPEMLYRCKSFSTCGTFTPDGKYLVFADDMSIVFYDIKTGKVFKKMGSCSSFVNEITFFGKEDFVTWCQDGTVNYWNYARQGIVFLKPLHAFKAGDHDAYSRLVFSPDRRMMITGSSGNNARVWDVNSHKLLADLKGHKDTVKGFSFTPDGKYIITASFDKTLKLWEVERPTDKVTETTPSTKTQVAEVKKPEPASVSADIKKEELPPLNNRKLVEKESMEVGSLKIVLRIWDNETVDGDKISLYLNGEQVVNRYELTKEKKEIELTLRSGSNYLALYAENLGNIPPNTATLEVFDGKATRSVVLESDLKQCGTLLLKAP